MVKRRDAAFVERVYNGYARFRAPVWQLPRGDSYEPVRCQSMREELKRGDVLFDLGSCDGCMSAIYATFVGAENMCLFEPAPDQWPNIRAIWEENNLPAPLSTFCGFVSDRTVLEPREPDHDLGQRDGWPIPAHSDYLLGQELHFRSVRERAHDTPQTSLDDFVERTGIVPNALAVDVEGAEILVLRGAKRVLCELRPLVWLSLHTINGALTYAFNSSREEILEIMSSCGYDGKWLADEGDEHWFFWPARKPTIFFSRPEPGSWCVGPGK